MTEPHEGLQLGRYTLVRQLGAGGMGSVWEAVLQGPEGFRKPVALKLLLAGRSADTTDVDRRALAREARIGALLHHPNVVGTHDLGEIDGRWYVAMELVRGPSLGEALASGGPLPGLAVIDAARQVCAGLEHVHGLVVDGRPAGLVHRDLKPSNLLLDRTGLVKIADLGIARLTAHEAGGIGTPGYLSEEQSAGKEDHRSDLFSLGATLFHLATGALPFGSGVTALYKVGQVEELLAQGLCRRVEEAVPGLGAVVHRCLRRDPADRWADAAELQEALTELHGRTPDGLSLAAVLARTRPDLVPDVTVTPVRRSVTAEPRTVGLAPGNLPPLRDPFFGRRDEVRQLAERVRGPERLLVLKGPGGTGKTRLALAVAREVSADLAGGSWFVDLSEAVTSAGVCSAVATAFQVPLDRQDPVRQLGRAFAYRGRSLFVLDNLEQIVDALPETLSRWLELAPEATFLCTSRLPLRLSGERVIPVEPLPVEDGVELFLDRSPRPPSAAERPIVAELVAALEGLPLAIELAAARTRLMPVRRLRERLSDRLRLLADGDRDRPNRQRSLTASLDGSWDLLAPWARDALVQLAVFEGGSTLEAAEGVLDLGRHPDAPWAVDVLAELVDASLLRTDPSGDRFRMLVVVQEWARTRAEPGALAAAEVRHGQWYARAGTDDAVARWSRAGGVSNHQELLPELDNLAAACRRAIARGDAAVAAATCSAAGDWLVFRGPVSTLVELAEAVLALPGVSVAGRRRVAALLATAHLNAGRLADAAGAHSLALGLAEREGNAVARAYLHGRIAWRLQLEGRGDEAAAELERAEAVARRHPAPEVEVVALREIGGVHWLAGRLPEARRVFERVIPLARRLGDERTEAFCTGNLGLVAVYLGDRRSARAHFERALVALARHGDRRNAALIHVNMGLVLHESGQLREARTQYQYALAELGQVGDERGRAMAASNLGYVLHELGECAAARELLEDTLTATRRASDLPTELLTLANLGLLQWDLGDGDGAARAWAETLERCTRTAQHRTATIVAAQLSIASLELGRLDEAREHLATARSAAVAAGLDREAWHAGVAARITLAAGSVEDGLRGLADSAAALRRADDLLWVPLQVQWAAACASTDPEAAAAALDEVVNDLRAGGYGGGLAEALIHRARARPATAAADLAEATRILDRGGYGPTAPLRRALADGLTAPR